MKLITVLVAVLSIASAQREDSLKVIDSLRQIQPVYRDFQTYLVKVVAEAKLNASNIIFELHSDILSIKENKLLSAIRQETDILHHINNQNPDIDTSCLDYLRGQVDNNILLSGFKFSSCILEIDDKLNQEIANIYNELDHNGSFQNISIYDVFRGQNIFASPNVIVDRLQEKLAALQNLPVEIVSEILALLNAFKFRLASVGGEYQKCLVDNDELLKRALDVVVSQLLQICQGTLAPLVTEVPEDVEPTNTASGDASVEDAVNGW